MTDDYFRRRYTQQQFTSLPTSIAEALPLLRTSLSQLALSQPITDVQLDLSGNAAIVEWSTLPLAADLALVDAAITSFAGGTTSHAPLELNSPGASTTQLTTPVDKLTFATPPLEAGTYQILWTSSIRMLAIAANTGVAASVAFLRSDGVSFAQDDSWDLNVRHAFNGALTFQVLAGQTLSGALRFTRLGASGTAEMSGARITVDKL
jgi:hypothetical protein